MNTTTTNTYTAYTGTFTKKDGSNRTMTFIRGRDIPSSVKRTSNASRTLSEGYEIVYDVNANGFRMFNWRSTIGEVSKRSINFSFDSTIG